MSLSEWVVRYDNFTVGDILNLRHVILCAIELVIDLGFEPILSNYSLHHPDTIHIQYLR